MFVRGGGDGILVPRAFSLMKRHFQGTGEQSAKLFFFLLLGALQVAFDKGNARHRCAVANQPLTIRVSNSF